MDETSDVSNVSSFDSTVVINAVDGEMHEREMLVISER